MPNEFLKEIDEYLDNDNLLGTKPNPRVGDSGNPLTLAGIAGIILNERGESNGTLTRIDYGVASLELGNGLPNKKADSKDEVTHDDILGMVCWSKMIGKDYHKRLYRYSQDHGYVLSNTKQFYMTALAKFWDIATYTMACGHNSPYAIFLILKIVVDCLTPFRSPSGDQLNLLRLKSIKESRLYKPLFYMFSLSCKIKYGSIGKMLGKYHGTDHPFAKYYP